MPNRIHIFGGPGSGKTSLARRLAAERGLPHVELDALYWDDEATGFAIRRNPMERDRRLAELVGGPRWILEGVYWSWCQPAFERAEQIILLETGTLTRQWRLGSRFVKSSLGLKAALPRDKKDGLRAYLDIARWNATWNRDNLSPALECLGGFESKLTRTF